MQQGVQELPELVPPHDQGPLLRGVGRDLRHLHQDVQEQALPVHAQDEQALFGIREVLLPVLLPGVPHQARPAHAREEGPPRHPAGDQVPRVRQGVQRAVQAALPHRRLPPRRQGEVQVPHLPEALQEPPESQQAPALPALAGREAPVRVLPDDLQVAPPHEAAHPEHPPAAGIQGAVPGVPEGVQERPIPEGAHAGAHVVREEGAVRPVRQVLPLGGALEEAQEDRAPGQAEAALREVRQGVRARPLPPAPQQLGARGGGRDELPARVRAVRQEVQDQALPEQPPAEA